MIPWDCRNALPREDKPHSKTNDHTWIISDVDEIKNWKMPQSSSKEAYVMPQKSGNVPRIGSRKKLYQIFFHQQSEKEMSQKLSPEEDISILTTEYRGNYNKPNCSHINKRDKEMQQKFPLYTKEPCASFWMQNANNIPGLTPSCDSKRIFHKNTSFTKPINEVLDDPYIKCPKEVSIEKWHKCHDYGNKIRLTKSFYF